MSEKSGQSPSIPDLNLRFPDPNPRGQIFSSVPLEASSSHYPVFEILRLLFGFCVVAGDGIEDFLLGFLGVDPTVYLDPLAWLEILVVVEKM